MYEPCRFNVIWDDPDIELRLMKALATLADEARQPAAFAGITPAALARVGDWFARRCSEVQKVPDNG